MEQISKLPTFSKEIKTRQTVSNTNIVSNVPVERRKWGQAEKEEPKQDNSFEDFEVENKINKEENPFSGNEDDNDDDLVNCLDSLNKEDLLYLRQSIKEGGLSKYLQQEKERLDFQTEQLAVDDNEDEEGK